MKIEGAEHFVTILKENGKLMEVIPWAQEIVNLHKLISHGCKCKKKSKAAIRDSAYKEVVTMVLANNSTLCDFVKEELSSDEVIFMLDSEELLKI